MTTSTKKSFPLYADQLQAILELTNILNAAGNAVEFGDQYHLRVQLVDSVTNKPIGEWSDEVSRNDWEFAIVQEEEKPKFNPHVQRIRGGQELPLGASEDYFQPANRNTRTITERAVDQREIPGGYVVND